MNVVTLEPPSTTPAADLEWATRRHRLGAAFELVVFDRLAPEEQAALSELLADPDLYGALRPRPGGGGTWKAVDRDLALLLLTLREAGPLPFFTLRPDPEAARRAIETLVLDGVLEVEAESGFVSGPSALDTLFPRAEKLPSGRLARVSIEALTYGAALGDLPLEELAARLYGYNREPLTAERARELESREAVLALLGAAPGTELAARLAASWQVAEGDGAWIQWQSLAKAPSGRGRGSWKLYVSPTVAALPRAFAVVAERLAGGRARAFKVGADGAGIVRPDKLVAYFDSLEALEAAAADLAPRLEGLPAQGVPFSAEIALDGLLSWGVDPPRDVRTLSWMGVESWRLWVVRRLAAALLAARETGAAPWFYALERMRLDGVDVDRWVPTAGLFKTA
ncbi:MAG TPA: hypothetical protein VF017_17315 [Thermoanaerobaculia bacterium]|nr:hypothetical protein [Thermoanaerobaculia bacterium]